MQKCVGNFFWQIFSSIPPGFSPKNWTFYENQTISFSCQTFLQKSTQLLVFTYGLSIYTPRSQIGTLKHRKHSQMNQNNCRSRHKKSLSQNGPVTSLLLFWRENIVFLENVKKPKIFQYFFNQVLEVLLYVYGFSILSPKL